MDSSFRPLIAQQRRHNLDTQSQWERFAPHRESVMTILQQASAESLLLLGAGNCNDVSLKVLADAFQRIQLMDCDGEALRAAADDLQMRAAVQHLQAITALEPAKRRDKPSAKP